MSDPAYEAFVNLELPKRATVLLSDELGYTGDPNAAVDPALNNAPEGRTYFWDKTASALWHKRGPTSVDWVDITSTGGGTGEYDVAADNAGRDALESGLSVGATVVVEDSGLGYRLLSKGPAVWEVAIASPVYGVSSAVEVTIDIDKDTGSDSDGNGTSGAPFQTFGAVQKAIGSQVIRRPVLVRMNQTTPLDPWTGADAAFSTIFNPDRDATADPVFGHYVRIQGSRTTLASLTVSAIAVDATDPTLLVCTVDEDLTAVSVTLPRTVAETVADGLTYIAVAKDSTGGVGTHTVTIQSPALPFAFLPLTLDLHDMETVVDSPNIFGVGAVVQNVIFRSDEIMFVSFSSGATPGLRVEGCSFDGGGPSSTQIAEVSGSTLERCCWNSTANVESDIGNPVCIEQLYCVPGSSGTFFIGGRSGENGVSITDLSMGTGLFPRLRFTGGKITLTLACRIYKAAANGIVAQGRNSVYVEDNATWHVSGAGVMVELATGAFWQCLPNGGQPAGQTVSSNVFSVIQGSKLIGARAKFDGNVDSTVAGRDVRMNGRNFAWENTPLSDPAEGSSIDAPITANTGAGTRSMSVITRQSVVQVGAYSAGFSERVLVDPSGGTFEIAVPTFPTMTTRFGVKNTTTDITAVTVRAGPGDQIEDPASPGTFSASGGTVSLAGPGAGAEWEYDDASVPDQWRLVAKV